MLLGSTEVFSVSKLTLNSIFENMKLSCLLKTSHLDANFELVYFFSFLTVAWNEWFPTVLSNKEVLLSTK